MSIPIAQRSWLTTNRIGILALIFLVALIPRLYSAQTVGWHWFGQGTLTVVNFDEANSCRAWLNTDDYSALLGAQTVTITALLGNPPPKRAIGNYRLAKDLSLIHI